MHGKVMVIGGSDSGGGAGIQADIKTITCLGGSVSCVVTGITAQSQYKIQSIHPIPDSFIEDQINIIFNDIGFDCIKLGALISENIVKLVYDFLYKIKNDFNTNIPVIVDPVIFAESGAQLLSDKAKYILMDKIFPLSDIITPNLIEASKLIGKEILSSSDMHLYTNDLIKLGSKFVLLKGGHLQDDTIINLLITKDKVDKFSCNKINNKVLHGTGCTVASAIAISLAQGLDMYKSVDRSLDYVYKAISSASNDLSYGCINHYY